MIILKNKTIIYLYLLPTAILFFIIYFASVATLGITSLADWTVSTKIKFAGIDNYLELIVNNDNFRQSVINTCIWMFLMITVHVGIGVLVALILAQKEFYWKFVRTSFMIPNIISSAALGMLFLSIYNPEFGIVNSIIRALGFKNFYHNWFMNYSTSFFTVSMTWLPYAAVVTILVLAEIASIPNTILESAKVDGAKQYQINIYILLPLLKNIIGTTCILSATSMLQKVDLILMTTGGGPGNETMNLPMFIYLTAMKENNFGLANAAGVILIAIGMITIVILSKLFKLGKVDY